ncbi:MAG: ATP-binding cassette domain-containing protein [Bacteroidetes bacterium]|nr:ATP-binding cassette domain-containing protein [Bacteroidota bacterium]
MISLQDIGFHFGGRYLYKDVNWQIFEGQRIGLVGLNGAGKSTLLRILSGDYTPSEGILNKSNDCTIGFLNQDLLSLEYSQSIYEVALDAFADVLKMEEELHELYKRLETDSSEELLTRLGDVQHRFESLDGYNIKHKTEEVLEGLGFETKDLHRPFSEFSGGWRMRVLLAKILLRQPRLLLLDEPTNHLDLPSIEWLEEYLRNYKGAVIVVSHDRYFLDRMVNQIAEIAYGKFYLYPGNYSFYLKSKAEREELQQRQYENQQQFIKQQERFIERFKAKASKSTQAQSRVKMLDKLDRIEAVDNPDIKINLDFKVKHKSGKVLKKFHNLSKAYDSNLILDRVDGEIQRGDKIALIGANGKGKTTLLKILAGEESYEGTLETGYQVIKSFYAQHQLEALNVENEILQELDSMGTAKTEMELRTVLGCFLFTGDDVFKKIKILSGGEKARVALAKCLIQEANFLLLDEPTNHLDMQSTDILVQALNNYTGTVIYVSHDRHFISRVATKIWWIEDHKLREYPGDYAEFTYWKENIEETGTKPELKKAKEKQPVQPPKEDNSAINLLNERKSLEKKLAHHESELEKLKIKKAEIELWLGKPENLIHEDEMIAKTKLYNKLESEIANEELSYEKVFESLLKLE